MPLEMQEVGKGGLQFKGGSHDRNLGAKKPINAKRINIFLTSFVEQSSLGRDPPQGQTGQNGDLTVELDRQQPGLSHGRVPVCPHGRVPVCPRDGSQFVLDIVPPKMFMFIGCKYLVLTKLGLL